MKAPRIYPSLELPALTSLLARSHFFKMLQLEKTNARAIQQLGLAHYRLGGLRQAFPFLLKAQDLDSNDLDVRLMLGTIYPTGRKLEEFLELEGRPRAT